MKAEDRNAAKELYKELRRRSWPELWNEEVPRFNAALPAERIKRAAVIRAVGVVFAESGPPDDTEKVRQWLRGLLEDPSEKVRRYAIAAMPKIGAGANEEQKLLSALQSATEEREKNILAQTLARIGGPATLQHGVGGDVEQKVKASIARKQSPSAVRINAVLADDAQLRIHLRGRKGLERFVSEEVRGKFRLLDVQPGRVRIVPVAPFSIADIYAMRCFGSVGFVLGAVETDSTEALASVITSELSKRLLRAFTDGAIRYRLNFVEKGHQRAAVDRLANLVYSNCPEILNDPRSVTWTIDIYPNAGGQLVELRPNMTPDPRFAYRQRDVPAASHPQLAACLARLAGRVQNEVIWDPFCGSGSELIESAVLGGIRSVYGTDLSSEAPGIAQTNFAAAQLKSVPAKFICGDFRRIALGGPAPTLIITNPPMGMRVPVADLKQLIRDLFNVSVKVLKPDGRLVFVNPISNSSPHPLLKLQFQQKVDMGGFECRMEKYVRVST
ncbi:MAG TPA: methyltransferase [Verrucomicrobiae bacterium]|jgi:23S rRNA G2445 N2-methylase RlmL|nr:methyltransferase [Verrucomicrobiae bacterium]